LSAERFNNGTSDFCTNQLIFNQRPYPNLQNEIQLKKRVESSVKYVVRIRKKHPRWFIVNKHIIFSLFNKNISNFCEKYNIGANKLKQQLWGDFCFANDIMVSKFCLNVV